MGTPGVRAMRVADQTWSALGADDRPWFPVSADDAVVERADPWRAWRDLLPVEYGNVVRARSRTIDSVACSEYLFAVEWQTNLGKTTSEIRLFVAENGLPMRLEAAVRASTVFTTTWQLSHINDPANIVRAPGE